MSDTFVRSMLGEQLQAGHVSAPKYGFGSGTRAHREKLFESAEISKTAGYGLGSPGPAMYGCKSTLGPQLTLPQDPQFGPLAYTSKRWEDNKGSKTPAPNAYLGRSSMGAQTEGAYASQPSYGMGSSTRDNVKKVYISEHHSNTAFQGVNSPGPSAYFSPVGVGKQVSAKYESPPTWLFGTLDRFKDPNISRQAKMPGPDAYNSPSGFGAQIEGTRHSAPLPGFGTSTRDHAAKVFMTPAHERTRGFGKLSPGPGASYQIEGSVGKQTLSTKRAAPARGFGTCDRFYTAKMAKRLADTPAPGAYNT